MGFISYKFKFYLYFNSIRSERFHDLATDVVSLFPTETYDTYYTPFTTIRKANGSSIRINAAGKLCLHYTYRKILLMDAGVIKPIKKVKESLYPNTDIREVSGKQNFCTKTEFFPIKRKIYEIYWIFKPSRILRKKLH